MSGAPMRGLAPAIALALSLAFAPTVSPAGAEAGRFPPASLIRSNLRAAATTLAVEVVEARPARTVADDRGRAARVVYRIRARVRRCYHGCTTVAGTPGVVEYLQGFEIGLAPPAPGARRIVGLARSRGDLVVPGVGYAFQYSDALDRAYERAAAGLGVATPPRPAPERTGATGGDSRTPATARR